MRILNSTAPYNLFGIEGQDYKSARVVVLPVPYDSTSTYRVGSREGPRAIIAASRPLELYSEELGLNICDRVGIFTLEELAPDYDSPLFDRGVERATIEAVENSLFKDTLLPMRYKGDHYFKGGDWLLLGAEYARYYARNGRLDDAQAIVNYICGKYCDDRACHLPEQEINGKQADNPDEGGLLARNGNKPIQDLAWSYAALLRAIMEINAAKETEAIAARVPAHLRTEPAAKLR